MFRGRWLPRAALASYALGLVVSIAVAGWVQTATHRYPGTGAWYFVQQDFINGACMLVSLLVSVSLAVGFRRRYPLMAMMALWLQGFTVGPVGVGVVIGLRTHHLFDPAPSTCPWPTLDAYLAFKGRMLGATLLVWVGVLIAIHLVLRRPGSRRPD